MVPVAQRHGIPYALSTMGTTSIEDFAAPRPQARKWFQLYVWRDRAARPPTSSRARGPGGLRGAHPDRRRAGRRPAAARRPQRVLDPAEAEAEDGRERAALHPAWWFNLLTTEPLTVRVAELVDMTLAELIDKLFDPSMTVDDLAWLRSIWSGTAGRQGHPVTSTTPSGCADAGADAVRAVQSRRPPARPRAGAAAAAARRRRRGRRPQPRSGWTPGS